MFRHFLFWCLLGAMALLSREAVAQNSGPQMPGQVIAAKVIGQVYVVTPLESLRLPLRVNGMVDPGQDVITGPASGVVLVFSNGATVSLGPDTRLSIDKFLQDPYSQSVKIKELSTEPPGSTSVTSLKLMRGEMISNVKKLNKAGGSTFTVQTPVGAAGIRGTTFEIFFKPGVDTASFGLRMVEGMIELGFGGRGRTVMVEGGKQVVMDGIGFDATSGRVTSVPDVPDPSPVSLATLAALQQAAAQALSSGQSVEFAPINNSNTQPPPPALPPQTAVPQGGTTSDQALASPAPVPPPPRTTGGDGTRTT